ncbi:hypothetical protein ACFOTA_04075 [Chitinophaga sp. GCM10012297]|uniref:YD repeat-containing protein n=1 Tax=Chitinophaga chungangae TaxID=2821488 RepID=A0ABS3Y9M3_9BACT|nr:hypothetical protein [Chitinophaga chungangae]MBO9151370.1 hypothetical protein [Chitinophaga chungangae]
MRILINIFFLLALGTAARAQYYYQDIYNTAQTAATMARFKANKVSFQTVKTLDANQETDNDFICIRSTNPSFRQLKAVTQSRVSGRSVLTSTFSGSGKLTRTVDSAVNSISTMQYQYTAAGALAEIQANSKGREDKFRTAEKRRYEYDSTGKLQRLVIKKEGLDSTIVLFQTDTAGKVTEEAAPGRQRVYYNYDAKGRLTDVLRYHPSRKRMLPDYSFEYDAQDRLAQMTVVNAETGDYLVWKYSYDEKGLPAREECYGKEKELLGMVRYMYEFFQ